MPRASQKLNGGGMCNCGSTNYIKRVFRSGIIVLLQTAQLVVVFVVGWLYIIRGTTRKKGKTLTKEEVSNPLKKVSSLLGGIGEYVAAVLAYIVALTGGAQTPYPQTISVLTALATCLALWFLRWPHIAKKAELFVLPKNQNQPPVNVWSQWLAPFTARTGYAMPHQRRRVEGGVLLAISIAAVVFSGTKSPVVYNELSWIRCSGAKGQPFKILVARFTLSAAEQTSLESQLTSALERSLGDTTICYYRKSAEFRDEALQLGEKYEAALVIWGSMDPKILRINIEPTGWDPLFQVVNIPESEVMEFRAESLDNVVPFLGQFILSEILYMRGETNQARLALNEYLSGLDSQSKSTINSENLAEAYFFLGTLFDTGISDSPDEKQALNAYSTAIQLNPRLVSALVNRGQVYFNRGEYDKAIPDLKAAVALSPDNPELYHFLGMLYLFDGQFQEARQAYQTVQSRASADQRNQFIGELGGLADTYPSLKGQVDEIILMLR